MLALHALKNDFQSIIMLVKLVSADMINRGLQLRPGLNVDPVSFSYEGDCVAGGLYYCDAQDIIHWVERLHGYTHLCTVTVPEDAQTVKLDNKYRSNMINLSQPYPIREHPMWSDSELCRSVVQSDGRGLRYVKSQTEELCRLAVRQNGWTLKHVKSQTEEICRLAVQKDGQALLFVKIQTEELCRLAVSIYRN